jgi:hypothetical protein
LLGSSDCILYSLAASENRPGLFISFY